MSRSLVVAFVSVVTMVAQATGEISVPDALVELVCEVRLSATEPGIIENVHVEEGDIVKQGVPIFSLDESKLRLEVVAAAREAEVAQMATENDVDARYAQKSEAVAAAELQRAQEAVRLFEKSVSKSELDQLRLVMERSQLAAEQAERDLQAAALRAELEQARADITTVRLENMQIKAPFDGVVVQLQKHAGEWAGVGEPIARVIQLDQLRVEGFVDGRKYDASLKGKPATMMVTLPSGEEATFSGRVTFVSPELNKVNGLIRVWAEVENPSAVLRPGMRGVLQIQND